MKFPYKKIELLPGMRREFLLKPIIPLYLFSQKSFVRVEALIDSGADFTVFHSELAEVLGIQWQKGISHKFRGITGSSGIVYFHSIKIKVGSWLVPLECGFSKNLGEDNYGILGQEGFFENFKVVFDLKTENIEVKRSR